MKKNVSTTLMTATLATVIGLGGATIANPTIAFAQDTTVQEHKKHDGPVIFIDETPEERAREKEERAKENARYEGLTNKEALELDGKTGTDADIPTRKIEPEKPAEVETPKVDVVVPEKDTEAPAEDVKPDAEVVAPEKDADIDVKDEAVGTEDKADADQPEAEVVAPEKDTETPAEDNAPAEVETPKVEDAEKPAVVPEVDTEVKTEEKKDTSDQPNTDTKPAEKVVDSKTSNEPKHMKKSATPETADVTAGVAAYLLGGLGLGLVTRKKK